MLRLKYQVTSWKQDNAGNYTGFFIKTFGLSGQIVSANVHYAVFGKQDNYTTSGDAIPILTNTDNSDVVEPEPEPEPEPVATTTPITATSTPETIPDETSTTTPPVIEELVEDTATTTPPVVEEEPIIIEEPVIEPEITATASSTPQN